MGKTEAKNQVVTNSVCQRCRKRALGWMGLVFVTLSTLGSSHTLEIIAKIPHSGYSEGLDFHQGFLWNALPQRIVKINPSDGSILDSYAPATEYSESLKWMSGKLWNLSFKNKGLYQGQLKNKQLVFEKVGEVPEDCGWGLEKVGNELVTTGNFSNKLYFFNPQLRKWTKTLATEGVDLEDLAWDGNQLWTSSFSTHRGTIFSINIHTGKIQSFWELPQKEECPIIDGIAFDGKSLWITGKECPSIYRVKVPSPRVITSK
ncbi:MAG: glutaminyl-peptide cyclotransferase [Pseudomonadota bacterium]